MLSLNKILITGYKNYRTASHTLTGRVTGICGLNGRGKTNLLDAVYFCCLTRSYFTSTDMACTRFGEEGFRLEAYFSLNGTQQKVVCIYRGQNRKEVSLNEIPYDKFSKHIGLLPVVVIAPDDIELVNGPGEIRRKFMDMVLCQLDPAYLQELITYNKILQQRNSLLKNPDLSPTNLHPLLDALDEQMLQPGRYIHEKRKAFAAELIPLVQTHYRMIAGQDEQVTLDHISQLNEGSLDVLLKQGRARDIASQRSQTGIHKDEWLFRMNGQPFRGLASQGQKKSLLFAIKLAEYDMIRLQKGFAPILLLDDVFEKLDDQRMHNLLHQVCLKGEGQVLITDTHGERLTDAFKKLGVEGQIIEL